MNDKPDAISPDSERSAAAACSATSMTRHYFGCEVVATKVYADPHPFPWMFTIQRNGVTHSYGGIPNKCESAASALKRAWWRCKWMAEGTYSKRYTPMPNACGPAAATQPKPNT